MPCLAAEASRIRDQGIDHSDVGFDRQIRGALQIEYGKKSHLAFLCKERKAPEIKRQHSTRRVREEHAVEDALEGVAQSDHSAAINQIFFCRICQQCAGWLAVVLSDDPGWSGCPCERSRVPEHCCDITVAL